MDRVAPFFLTHGVELKTLYET